jgi:hypothetical protein
MEGVIVRGAGGFALALVGGNDLSATQVRCCVGELDDANLRNLTTGLPYHLLVPCKQFDTSVADVKLHALAKNLLPPELR